MWPFSRSKKRIQDNAFYREFFGALETQSGETVNYRTAQQAVTAMACARVIAEGLAQVPCKIFRKNGDQRLPATDQRIYGVLNDSPNDWMTSFEFFESMALHLVFCGNAFAFINRYRGDVIELLPYEPNHVTVTRDGWDLKYTISMVDSVGRQKITHDIPASNMWHIRGPSWNTWMGLEGVKLAREAIGLELAVERHGSRIFKNGTQLGGLLSTDNNLSKEKAAEIREAWQQQYGGGENTGKTGVLWGGFKYSSMSMKSDEAQMNETRKFQVEEVCRAFRVMPLMVGYADKTATYASAEQMFIAHAVHTLGPWYRRVEKSSDKNLLTDKQRADGLYTKFMANSLMRASSKDRGEYFAKALGSGGSPAWMTQDEVRELDELNPKGGSAAQLPIPTNVGGSSVPAEGENDGQTQS
jgi:HK97 family phage portal protein